MLGVPRRARAGLASGSWVYAYGPRAVLKLYPAPDYGALRRYRTVLAPRLRGADFPFATPAVRRAGRAAGVGFAVHRRMPGRPFSSLLPQLEGEQRRRALLSYLSAAERLGTLCFPERPFGPLLASRPRPRETWPDFLRAWAAEARAGAADDLGRDVPDLDRAAALHAAEAELVGDVREKRLVHGDYWPANVFVGDELQVSGVIDFSRLTLVGDPRVDAACAVIYLELVEGHRPEDLRLLRTAVGERHGPRAERVLAFYRLHYSFVFAGCKRSDPATYRWCVGNLRDAGDYPW
jgi:aminoglycoside phosphotransferase (APT) family kinase protein